MITLRFQNESDGPLTLFVEPWCSREVIANGSKFSIRYLPPPGEEDRSFVELRENWMTFWCEGPDFEIEIDGEIVIPFGVG